MYGWLERKCNTHIQWNISVVSSQSCTQLFVTQWTIACQAPLPMGFSRQEYQSGLPFPSPGDLPNPGIKPTSPALAGEFFYLWATIQSQKEGNITICDYIDWHWGHYVVKWIKSEKYHVRSLICEVLEKKKSSQLE